MMKMKNSKRYSELIQYSTFEDRLRYLKLNGEVGVDTFGFDRYLNQQFYRSKEWKTVRDFVIVRDMGNDLGLEDHPIRGKILVHHMNPIDINDISESTDFLLNPEYLICVSQDTHNQIHYGYSNGNVDDKYKTVERKPNDTCLWK